jgi:hypothetical protein
MTKRLCAGLLCLAVGILLGGEAIAQEAETAKSQTASETEASRPALDLVDQAEHAQSAKDNAPSGKGKTEEPATSTTLSTTSTATASSSSTGTTAGAAPRQPILPYNGTFDTSIPIRVPAFHGIEPKLGFHYNSAQSIRDFSRPGGELGIGWNISGLSVIEAASTGRGVPKFDGTDTEGRIAAYKLSYETSSTSGSSRLTAVQEYGTDSVLDASGSITTGTSMPAHVMSYSDAMKSFSTGASFSATTPHYVGDFNGDSLSDYANADSAGTSITGVYYYNNLGGYEEQTGFSSNLPSSAVRLYIADFTADQRSDFLKFYGSSSSQKAQVYTISSAAPFTSLNTETTYTDHGSDYTGTNLGKTAKVGRSFDPYGNVTQEISHGDTSVAGDEVTTAVEYVANTSAYIVGLAARERVFSGEAVRAITKVWGD